MQSTKEELSRLRVCSGRKNHETPGILIEGMVVGRLERVGLEVVGISVGETVVGAIGASEGEEVDGLGVFCFLLGNWVGCLVLGKEVGSFEG